MEGRQAFLLLGCLSSLIFMNVFLSLWDTNSCICSGSRIKVKAADGELTFVLQIKDVTTSRNAQISLICRNRLEPDSSVSSQPDLRARLSDLCDP